MSYLKSLKNGEPTPEVAKAIYYLLRGAFQVELNMSDTFAFACADSEGIDMDDFAKIIPIVAEHGDHALTAYVAVKRDEEPIHCPCGHDGPPFHAAKEAILKIKAEDKEFLRGYPERYQNSPEAAGLKAWKEAVDPDEVYVLKDTPEGAVLEKPALVS